MRVHYAARLVRYVPDGSARHHHVTGRRAYPAYPGSHVVGSVQDHALLGQAVDVGRVENGARIVDLEVKRGLVVNDDEEEVRALPGDKAMAKKAGNG